MSSFSTKPRKDWSLEPKKYPGAPPVSAEAVRLYNEKLAREQVKNPYLVRNEGLSLGDTILVSWAPGVGATIVGCEVTVRRGNRILTWPMGGILKDHGGRFLYSPYLTTLAFVKLFVQLLATASGHSFAELEMLSDNQRVFTLHEPFGGTSRLVSGDRLQFDDGTLRVVRTQGHISEVLGQRRPCDESGVLFESDVSYIKASHHTVAVTQTLAEVSALYIRPVSLGVFELVSR